MAETLFEEMKRYVGFAAEDGRALAELGPWLEPQLPLVVEAFYERLAQHPGALSVISGPERVARLKVTLVAWLTTLLHGPWDEAYFEERTRIGRRHVQIGLPQHYNFTAMNVIRDQLVTLTLALQAPAESTQRRVSALGKVLDLELAIILHTYAEDSQAQLMRHERLATFGQMTTAIGHELRNPLGVIDSSAFLLRKRIGADPGAARHLDRIQSQVARSNAIITTLLDIVRDRPPVRSRVSPLRIAEQALAALWDATGREVELRAPEALPEVSVDERQIEQALLNLLTNAAEAAGPEGLVKLTLRQHGDQIEWLVSDSGPGVDPALRTRIFEPLVTGKSEGVGLGLALSRKFVNAHGGTLELLPSGELSGAAFALRLPARSDA